MRVKINFFALFINHVTVSSLNAQLPLCGLHMKKESAVIAREPRDIGATVAISDSENGLQVPSAGAEIATVALGSFAMTDHSVSSICRPRCGSRARSDPSEGFKRLT
jgi:hypothetical protein